MIGCGVILKKNGNFTTSTVPVSHTDEAPHTSSFRYSHESSYLVVKFQPLLGATRSCPPYCKHNHDHHLHACIL